MEQYIHTVVNSAIADSVRDSIISVRTVPSSSTLCTSTKEMEIANSAYNTTLEHYLYRNNCYRRLALPQRAVPLVQVDLYGIQEILAVRVLQQNSTTHAPVSIPSGVSPKTYLDLFNKPTILTPTATTHSAAALDIYAVMQLSPRKSTPNSRATSSSAGAMSTNSSAAKKPTYPLSAKYAPLGSVVTSVHKAEARRTPLEQNDPVTAGASTSATGAGVSNTSNIVPNAWYSQQKAGITRSVDYQWRDQALFRFPLPEGVQSLFPPPGTPEQQLFPVEESRSGVHIASTSSSSISPMNAYADSGRNGSGKGSVGNGSDRYETAVGSARLPPVVLSIPETYFKAPIVLTVAVYERTFFSDTLLGELELDLAPINGKRSDFV